MNINESREPWLDFRPKDWLLSRIKNHATLSPRGSGLLPDADELCTVLPMEMVSEDGNIDVSNIVSIQDLQNGLTQFECGDVLFAKITPCMENGKGGFVRALSTRYGFGSTEFHVLRPFPSLDGNFLYYFLKNSVFRAYAAENMTGAAGQKRVSSRFLKEAHLCIPPPTEQERIAAYLDASCSAIDAAVTAKRRQLETLDSLCKSIIAKTVTKGLNSCVSFRQSGVTWFTDIPCHWECGHLKRFATRIQAGTTPPTDNPDYYFEGTVPWFAPGSFHGELDLNDPKKLINVLAIHEGFLRLFPAQSVFLVGIGATIGKAGIIGEIASCNQQIIGIVTNQRMMGRYLTYLLQIYKDIIPGIAIATTLPIFDQVKTGYLPVLQPPLSEQLDICEFLDKKLAEIRNLVTLIESQISTLIVYRKSLIHECVTGQRRITAEDVMRAKKTLAQAAG